MSARRTVLRDVVGFRGEKKLELCLTNYQPYKLPLFKPGFLGDKWPVIDFYVELLGLRKHRLFFLAQSKATAKRLAPNDTHIQISSKRSDVHGLMKLPGPTYMFAVHEPSGRVFVQCVHARTPIKAITRIAVANELTPPRLKNLHDEVKSFWKSSAYKPATTVFP